MIIANRKEDKRFVGALARFRDFRDLRVFGGYLNPTTEYTEHTDVRHIRSEPLDGIKYHDLCTTFRFIQKCLDLFGDALFGESFDDLCPPTLQ